MRDSKTHSKHNGRGEGSSRSRSGNSNRSEAAKKGWVTRRRNMSKSK